jgi:hypothetical protein
MVANGVAVAHDIYSLVRLDREAVRNLWPSLIRPGLQRIKRKDPLSGHWRPEHVRQRIEAGFAGQLLCECHAVVRDHQPVGFVVLTAYNDEFDGAPERLWVWIAWCEGASLEAVLPFVLPQLEQRAEELGLRGIVGVSSRAGWARRLTKHGYKARYIFLRDFVDG